MPDKREPPYLRLIAANKEISPTQRFEKLAHEITQLLQRNELLDGFAESNRLAKLILADPDEVKLEEHYAAIMPQLLEIAERFRDPNSALAIHKLLSRDDPSFPVMKLIINMSRDNNLTLGTTEVLDACDRLLAIKINGPDLKQRRAEFKDKFPKLINLFDQFVEAAKIT